MSDKNPCFGWILRDNPNFFEDNGFEKKEAANFHYYGCGIAKYNKHTLYEKRLYIDHDNEEEAAVELFCCGLGVCSHDYIIAFHEWNNAGHTGFSLQEVRQVTTIDQYNKLITEWGLDKVEDGSFLLKHSTR